MGYVKVKQAGLVSMPQMAERIGMPYQAFWMKVKTGSLLSPTKPCGQRVYYTEEDVGYVKHQAEQMK